MKKLGLIVLVAGIILMAGCAGDDPVGPGDLPTVTGLEVLATSSGRTVNLSWNAVTGTTIDGYEIYFKSNGDGSWVALDTETGTTYSHTADNSGTYSVRAYEGTDFSENYSNVETTMPTVISDSYTIWDNHAPEIEHSGFIFGATSGTTGRALDTGFDQDIYCYDGDWSESPCGFYSGDHAPFGNGSHTDMIASSGSTYGYPSGSQWWQTGYILAGDVIFCELSNGHYVKVFVSSVPQHATQPLSHGIIFYYDYQPINGLYLFTTDSTP